MEKIYLAKQFGIAVQMMVQGLDISDGERMRIADIYPEWVPGQSYSAGKILKYGVNGNGETQLYKVLQDHVSQSDWQPDTAVPLYKKVGYTEEGVPVWTQPLGASDAYGVGDKVAHNGRIWVSTIEKNVWEPGVYGWQAGE